MEKYLISGQAVEVIQALEGGKFLVKPIYEEDRDEREPCVWYGNPEIVDAVFDTPPREKWDATIKELETRISSLKEAKRQMEQENQLMDRELAGRQKAYSKLDALKTIDAFIAGKITHYAVIHDYASPRILEYGEATTVKDDYEHRQRLLSLYGDSKGNLSWRLNNYSTPGPSGSSYECYPCLSYQEALEKVQSWLTGQIEKTKDKPSANVASWAQYFNVDLPDGYIDTIAKNQIQSHASRIAKLQEDIKVEQSKIDTLKSGQVEATWKGGL